MPICDFCTAHLTKRYILTKDKELHLVNVPPHILKQLTIDDLEYIKRNAEEGSNVCRSCKRECSKDLNECVIYIKKDGKEIKLDPKGVRNLLINQRKIDHRLLEDTIVTEAVKKEAERRSNIIKTLAAVGKLQPAHFPKVPTTDPQMVK